MSWLVLVTSSLCYALGVVQRNPKLKHLPYLFFKQTFALPANKQIIF